MVNTLFLPVYRGNSVRERQLNLRQIILQVAFEVRLAMVRSPELLRLHVPVGGGFMQRILAAHSTAFCAVTISQVKGASHACTSCTRQGCCFFFAALMS